MAIVFGKCQGYCWVFSLKSEWSTPETLQLFTDSTSSANLGCSCYFQGQWAYYQWSSACQNAPILRDITFLELAPIALAFVIIGMRQHSKRIILHIDNISLVYILNNLQNPQEFCPLSVQSGL